MATARVATTILRLLPVFVYGSGDPRGRHDYLSILTLLLFGEEDLTTAIGATIGAGVVREPRLLALRTQAQLRQCQVMMRPPLTLAGMGSSLLWKRSHNV